MAQDAGHSAKEDGILSELVAATDGFRPAASEAVGGGARGGATAAASPAAAAAQPDSKK